MIVEKMKLAYVEWKEDSFPGLLGNVIAGRIANRFDLGGANCVVDAACASSLSALTMAVEPTGGGSRRYDDHRRRGYRQLAVYVHVFQQDPGALEARRRAPPLRRRCRRDDGGRGHRDGRCSSGWPTPSATATASMPSSRASAHPATAIQEHLRAAPGGAGQGTAPRLRRCGICVRTTVGLIEAHGTGTPAGDPAEFDGAARGLRTATIGATAHRARQHQVADRPHEGGGGRGGV